MPEILNQKLSDADLTKLFMGLAMAIVLVMQQWQTMSIAAIKTQAEVNRINFMNKEEILKISDSMDDRIRILEESSMPKEAIIASLKELHQRIDNLENQLNEDERDAHKAK